MTEVDEQRQRAGKDEGPDVEELARKGAVLVSLLVLVVSLIYLFTAVEDLLRTWLEPQWVPAWRALFAVGVGALAVWTLLRLTKQGG